MIVARGSSCSGRIRAAQCQSIAHTHRRQICSFNDDIQGTAAVAVAAIVGGMRISATPLADLRVVIVGAGSAGIGIARQATSALVSAGLPAAEAPRRCWLVDRDGLLHDRLEGLHDFQAEFVRPWESVAHLADDDGQISLLDVVRHVAPHAGRRHRTARPVHRSSRRAQADNVIRPIVLPLSNPTPRAECIPADVLDWTDGRALVGTGSPFPAAIVGTRAHPITQVNNLYLFPGLGRGVIAVRAREVSDSMLSAAATAIGSIAPTDLTAPATLLPSLAQVGEVARRVAVAVARQAVAEGLAEPLDDGQIVDAVEACKWRPQYRYVHESARMEE
jgi:malate dehydrogenase (oxaloacetate-decarboxylating)